jgi:cardiolipin synthase (CMP-forming)
MLAWIPNALSVSRCVFAVLVLCGALNAAAAGEAFTMASGDEALRQATLQQLWHQFALLSFISGALTDFLDGWTARQFKAESRFGVWLDPIADKLLVGLALLGLAMTLKTWLIYFPAALMAPSDLAKLKTGIEMAAIAGLMLPYSLAPATVEQAITGSSAVAVAGAGILVVLLWTATALSLFTAAQYVRAIRTG